MAECPEIYIAENLVRQGCVGYLELTLIAGIRGGLVGRDVIGAVGSGTVGNWGHGGG